MSAPESPRLAQALDRLAREQPARRAPATLSPRVMAVIARRAARPWWRQDFQRWPSLARLLFVVCAGLPVVFASILAARFDGQLASLSQRVESLPQFTALQAIGTAAGLVTQVFSNEWFYGGALAITLLYAAMFALGAAGYRALYARR